MNQSERVKEFKNLVNNKYNIYNALFLNLPYRKVNNIGMLTPLLFNECKEGLEAGKEPKEILDTFFSAYAKIDSEKDKIDFMFRIIQYVERQVVLYDSVEDAAFPKLNEMSDALSIKDFTHLINSKDRLEKIAEKLSTFSARIVLTAHPTQFYAPPVLDIMNDLRTLILENKTDEIDYKLQQLGLTSLGNSKKPTPLDEAKNIIYFLRNVYYHAVGELYSLIKTNLGNDVSFDNPDIIKLGFWPGGDRDGNPFVTASITKDVANELRVTLMKCYYHDLKSLKLKISFAGAKEILQELGDLLYKAMFDVNKSIGLDDILNPLLEVRELLVTKYHHLFLKDLDGLIDKVRIFKTHFATLDIRQDHSIHEKVMRSILLKNRLIKDSIDELSKEELIDILLHKKLKLDPADYDEDIVKDTIVNIYQLKELQKNNGQDGCNRYIISNSEDVFSVLFVYGMFRWCGWNEKSISFDIVPLFETMNGMRTSEQTMQELFDLPEYRAHLNQRNNKHTIMLGFSDGTKDGGYIKANWEIFRTKETLSAVCEQNDIAAIFFDGRGGPPARGGGKTHRFYASQGKNIANNEIQLTIQGQTITSNYGTKELFKHNCEQLLTAGLSNDFFGEQNIISEDSRALLEELSDLSFEKYDALKNHDMFISYLENRSTLKYYGNANIGSRPAKRGNKKKLELTDLRAISFVGSWSQLKQNVPGYFGIGTALKSLADQGKLESLKQLYKDVPFFKTLMLNSMMSLSKCYFELTSYMKRDEEYKDFWHILHDEYQLSKKMLLDISESSVLMEEEQLSRESIKIREEIVLSLLVIQQYALQKVNEGTEFKEIYEKMITKSLYGNINASRNSA